MEVSTSKSLCTRRPDASALYSYQSPDRPPTAKVDKPTKTTETVAETGVESIVEEAASTEVLVEAEATEKTKHSRKRKRPRSKLKARQEDATDIAMALSTTGHIAAGKDDIS